MKTFKAILNCGVDLFFGVVILVLVIWHMLNPAKDFTLALWPLVGYIIFNIINKVQVNLKRKDICKSCGKIMQSKGNGDYVCMNPYCDNYVKLIRKDDNCDDDFFDFI